MYQELSDSDKKVYALIRNRVVHGLESPTLREINEVTDRSSPRSAVLALERLESAGLIRRVGRNRIKLTSASLEGNRSISTVEIPLVGSVAAGIPILAKENIETMIPVSSALARPGYKYFLLRVEGESMNRAEVRKTRIEDKNIVLVRQQTTAENGDIVVALIDDEATVKVFDRSQGVVILRPKSTKDSYKPIVLSENCLIQGVVVAVLPKNLY